MANGYSLGMLLELLGIKQRDVVNTFKTKYNFSISQGEFCRKCQSEVDFMFGKKAKTLMDLLKQEYGIVYENNIWMVNENGK